MSRFVQIAVSVNAFEKCPPYVAAVDDNGQAWRLDDQTWTPLPPHPSASPLVHAVGPSGAGALCGYKFVENDLDDSTISPQAVTCPRCAALLIAGKGKAR